MAAFLARSSAALSGICAGRQNSQRSKSAGSSGEETKKGAIAAGQLADVAVLSVDYFAVPEEEVMAIELVLTIVNRKVVYGTGAYKQLAPWMPPPSPSWSPVRGNPIARGVPT